MLLISLNASQRKRRIEWHESHGQQTDVLNALPLRGNNANHMPAYILGIILLRACENMENVNIYT